MDTEEEIFEQRDDPNSRLKNCTKINVRLFVFNAIFNNMSVILRRSVLLLKETRNKTTQSCHKSLTNLITKYVCQVHLNIFGNRTQNIACDRK